MSLLHLTIMLIHSRQQGRSLWRRWSLVGEPKPFSHDGVDGYQLSAVAYAGKLLPGIRLIKAPDNVIPPQGKIIFCIFGCKVQSDHKWLCRQAYVFFINFLYDRQSRKAYAHQTIRRYTKRPACPVFPDSLLAMDAEEFCRPRKIDGIDLFYRYHPSFEYIWLPISNLIVSRRTHQDTNYLTSLYVLGRSLLLWGAALEIQRMMDILKVESNGDRRIHQLDCQS